MIKTREMKISRAIKKQSQVYAEADSAYLQNITAVNGYVLQVLLSEMPALLLPPPNYSEFLITFTKIKSTTLGWVNSVLYKLMEVPQTINKSNDDILRLFGYAQEYAEDLHHKYDANTAALLVKKLKSIDSELSFLKQLIANVIKKINDYDDQLPGLVDDFNELLDDYKQTVQYDEDQIDVFEKKTSQLQGEIAALWIKITLEIMNAGGAIIMGKLAKKIKNKYVKVLAQIMSYGLAVTLINDIVNSLIKISAKNGEINVITEKMDQLTIDIASLVAANAQFEGLRDNVSNVQDNLEFIEGKWDELSQEIKKSIVKIENAQEDVQNEEYKEVIIDVIEARSYWEETVNKSKLLELNYKVKDAEIDMDLLVTENDSEKVAEEKMLAINKILAEAKEYPAIEYYNLI